MSEMPWDRGHVERLTDVTGTDCNKWSERLQGEEKKYELQHIFLTRTGAIRNGLVGGGGGGSW